MANTEERLELAVWALSESIKLNVLLLQRQSELLDRQKEFLKRVAKILVEADRQQFEKAITEAMKRGSP